MKGDQYHQPKNYEASPNMFLKLQHHNSNPHHPPSSSLQQQHHDRDQDHNNNNNHHHHHHHLFPNPYQISARACQTPDDENTSSHTSSGPPANSSTPNRPPKPTSEPINPPSDGATIEVSRRPRGRPPGSKNKPKPPVFITRNETDQQAMSPYILEIPNGNDIVEALAGFCRNRNLGLCVLTGSGTVSNVTLRQPSTTSPPGATVTFHGRFDILSICATFMPQTTPFCPVPNGFTISLAGPQGQIVGGLVAGALLTTGTVYLIAASFNNPSFHRLPAEEELRNSASGEGHSSPASGGGESGGHARLDSSEMPMYSGHLPPSDVLWAPTATRQPPPPPPY